MATTRIMPLHVGKGRTESRAISDIIDYVANPKKTDNGRLITGYACDSRTADAEFLLAKQQYIAATGRVRGTDDVIAYPVISLLVVAAIVLLVCLATPVITFMQNVKQSVVERLRQN